MNRDFFLSLCASEKFHDGGIGTLSERSLHSVLKSYYEPDSSRREVKTGKFVADIVGENGIIEIQTRALYRLRKKLEAFLPYSHVTVVFPIAVTRYVCRVDSVTGNFISRRKSPAKGRAIDILSELYPLKHLLTDKNLTVITPLLEVETYKTEGKRESLDRVPVDIVGELIYESPYDYLSLLPETLPERFTSSDLSKNAPCSLKASRYALNVLSSLGLISEFGTSGRKKLYSK